MATCKEAAVHRLVHKVTKLQSPGMKRINGNGFRPQGHAHWVFYKHDKGHALYHRVGHVHFVKYYALVDKGGGQHRNQKDKGIHPNPNGTQWHPGIQRRDGRVVGQGIGVHGQWVVEAIGGHNHRDDDESLFTRNQFALFSVGWVHT